MATFLVSFPPTSTIANTSLLAILAAVNSVRSVIFLLAISSIAPI